MLLILVFPIVTTTDLLPRSAAAWSSTVRLTEHVSNATAFRGTRVEVNRSDPSLLNRSKSTGIIQTAWQSVGTVVSTVSHWHNAMSGPSVTGP